MKYLFTIMLFVIAFAMTIQAQTVTTTITVPPVTTTVQVPLSVKVPVATTEKVSAEIIASSSNKVVKGAPFSAEGVSESLQVLADGNRITRSSTTKMARDGEGRFRREGNGGSGGSGFGYTTYGGIVSVYGVKETISIFDPVEGVRYVLYPDKKSASRFSVKPVLADGMVYTTSDQAVTGVFKAQISSEAKKNIELNVVPKADVVVMPSMVTKLDDVKAEQLGTRSFEGVEAEGKRTTTTIEAGKIGNERPIEVVYERWYSKELDLIVYSRHYDPRFGEQIYRLVNINRSEPDRSLFTVPSDYKVTTEQPKSYTMTTTTTPPATKPTVTTPATKPQ